jgi:hypothetical protein
VHREEDQTEGSGVDDAVFLAVVPRETALAKVTSGRQQSVDAWYYASESGFRRMGHACQLD